MSTDSKAEQNNSGSESFTDFEEEIEGLVGAVAIDDDAEIDRPYMGGLSPSRIGWETATIGERRRDNKMKCFLSLILVSNIMKEISFPLILGKVSSTAQK